MAEPLEIPGPNWNHDDYTYYPLDNEQSRLLDKLRKINNGRSWALEVIVRSSSTNDEATIGRALICLCHRGKQLSVTVRRTSGGVAPKDYSFCNALSSAFEIPEQQVGHKGRLVPAKPLCDLLADHIIPKVERYEGLIVVTGSTASGKSTITRGLIQKYLSNLLSLSKDSKNRRPHLVTCEDPIEKLFFDKSSSDGVQAIDYTPREIGIDVKSLKEAFADAKRQTPAVVYIGEIRNRREWSEVVDFAGTGHLVIATAHAGSLVEAMNTILVSSPSARTEGIAQRILSVIHLTSIAIKPKEGFGESKLYHALVPTIWRRTEPGVKSLVSDGLDSLLPHCPKDNDPGISTLGRHYFSRGLYNKLLSNNGFTSHQHVLATMIQESLAYDLRGR